MVVMKKVSRRRFVKGSAALTAAGSLSFPVISYASLPTDKRLIVVILRGGMDGLHAVAPFGDKYYWKHRKWLALPEPGKELGIIDLDGFFGLHPQLATLKQYFDRKELAIMPAVASPYRSVGKRSHFDAQKLLELGTKSIGEETSGWLNRALQVYKDGGINTSKIGIAVGQGLPLIFQGNVNVPSWMPSGAKTESQEDFFRKVSEMHGNDSRFGNPLKRAMETEQMVLQTAHEMDVEIKGMTENEKLQAKFVPFLVGLTLPASSMKVFGNMMTRPNGPRIAVIESSGWDTHVRQGTTLGPMAKMLWSLADTLDSLAKSLGNTWKDTVIVVVTEFGRTVRDGGSDGTDHGTASTSFVMGGAVNGGKVIGEWPGLKNLFEDRDIRPTIDMRSVFKTLLHKHMGLDLASVNQLVFPGSEDAPIIESLIR